MKRWLQSLTSVLVLLAGLASFSACEALANLGENKVVVTIVYGSEKQEWLEPLVAEYNQARNKTEAGSVIEIQVTAMGSIESVRGIIDQSIQPTVWSPASSIYIPVANAEWRKMHSDDLVVGTPKDLVLSPVVIALWKPMAEALGWPDKPLGWKDIAELATSPEGWTAFGYPEWGSFKFGHTHPDYSNSGVVAIIAQAYAGIDKQRGLTLQDLQDQQVIEFMSKIQASIIHYGTSTGFFATRMFERGPSYLSAAVIYENLIVAQETKRLSGESNQIPVVAIYPKEGTFWSNHPYAILNAPWVSDEQAEAARLFEAYLLAQPQQIRAIQLGFRPADPSIPLTSPLDTAHGVDISYPKTVLEIPKADVITGVQQLWEKTKKPVDLVVVIDTSGSMSGDKISAARTSLLQFVQLLDDRDRLQVITFNSQIYELSPMSELGPKREEVNRRISGIIEDGDTSLYDAVVYAYEDLKTKGDPSHIRAIVVLSDGQDTYSNLRLDETLEKLSQGSQEGGNAIKLFTIGFGDDADEDVLKNMAETTGAKFFKSSVENIQKIYAEIATFF